MSDTMVDANRLAFFEATAAVQSSEAKTLTTGRARRSGITMPLKNGGAGPE